MVHLINSLNNKSVISTEQIIRTFSSSSIAIGSFDCLALLAIFNALDFAFSNAFKSCSSASEVRSSSGPSTFTSAPTTKQDIIYRIS